MARKKVEAEKEIVELSKEECPYELPEGWKWGKWGSVCEFISGSAFKKEYQGIIDKDIPFYKVGSLKYCDNNGYLQDNSNFIDEDIRKKLKARLIVDNSIIFAKIGEAIRLNRRGINNVPCCIDNNLMAATNLKCNFRYMFYWSVNLDIYQYANATTVPAVRKSDLEKILFPLPPKETQQKIVDIIESFFTKLDVAQEKVEQVLAESEKRRSAILHNAFSGKLTEKWREENNVSFDSWQNYQLKEICEVNPKKINPLDKNDEIDVSFIPMTVVSDVYGTIVEHQIRKLKEVKKGYTNFINGDVIFAKITPCMENGKSAIVSNLINDIGYGSTEFYVIRCSDKISNNFVYHLVRWNKFREEAKMNMKGAVGQQRVPKKFIEEYNIILPEFFEQKEIVRLLDKFLSVEDKVKSTCQNTLETIATMRKSILAKAFRGELIS